MTKPIIKKIENVNNLKINIISQELNQENMIKNQPFTVNNDILSTNDSIESFNNYEFDAFANSITEPKCNKEPIIEMILPVIESDALNNTLYSSEIINSDLEIINNNEMMRNSIAFANEPGL